MSQLSKTTKLQKAFTKKTFESYCAQSKGRTIIFLPGGSHFGKINCLHKKSMKKLSAEKFPKKIVCTTLVKLEILFFCDLLDVIHCSVW